MNPFLCRACILLTTLLLLFVDSAFAKPILHIVRPLRGCNSSIPIDMSADGRIVAGNAELKSNLLAQAFRQVRAHSAKKIQMNIPAEATVAALSADGAVVLGTTYNAAGWSRAYRWTKETGPVDLSSDPDAITEAAALSGNGRVAVGLRYGLDAVYEPFFWSVDAGLQPLVLFGYDYGYAFGVNFDGSVIVGFVGTTNRGRTDYACRWINMGEPEVLDRVAGESYASGVTPDGSVIIGGGRQTNAFYWARSFGMQWIEPGENNRAINFSDLSADASRIVGFVQGTDTVLSAILWTPDNGVQNLNQLFGSVLPRGWRFVEANAISADGRWIAGSLEGPKHALRGYILDTGHRR